MSELEKCEHILQSYCTLIVLNMLIVHSEHDICVIGMRYEHDGCVFSMIEVHSRSYRAQTHVGSALRE